MSYKISNILNTGMYDVMFDFSKGHNRLHKVSDITNQISYITFRVSYLVYI